MYRIQVRSLILFKRLPYKLFKEENLITEKTPEVVGEVMGSGGRLVSEEFRYLGVQCGALGSEEDWSM